MLTSEQIAAKRKTRLIIVGVVAVVGGFLGWLVPNLLLDFVLGGRLFS